MSTIPCPGCDHPIRYTEKHAGQRGKCKKCGFPFRLPPLSDDPPADPEEVSAEVMDRALLLLTGGVCQSCQSVAPTRKVSFNYHVGAIILFFHGEISGRLCKVCINKYFSEYTLITFFGGWWGLISCVITPFILLANVCRFLLSIRLAYGPGQEAHRDNVTPWLILLLVFTPILIPLLIAAVQALHR